MLCEAEKHSEADESEDTVMLHSEIIFCNEMFLCKKIFVCKVFLFVIFFH